MVLAFEAAMVRLSTWLGKTPEWTTTRSLQFVDGILRAHQWLGRIWGLFLCSVLPLHASSSSSAAIHAVRSRQ